MLLNGFWHEVHTNDFWTDIHLDLHALIEGDFAAATVAITFGALLGKVSPLQMIGIAFFELLFYSLNFYVSVPSPQLACGARGIVPVRINLARLLKQNPDTERSAGFVDWSVVFGSCGYWWINVHPHLWCLLWAGRGVSIPQQVATTR